MAKGKQGTGKWKYGSVSALMLAMVLVALIALNAGAYTLEKNNGWRIDLSFNGILSQSAATKEVLQKLDKRVEIYALFRKSERESGWLELQELLDKYAAESEMLSWRQVDPSMNPTLVGQFTTDNIRPGESNLIVWCEQTNRFRIVGGEDFMGLGLDLEAGEFVYNSLTYENSITAAIAYVMKDRVPQAVIMQGHNEYKENELTDFRNLLEANQYEVIYRNLRDNEYTPNPEDLLIFFSPYNDLTDAELAKLKDFAAKGGSFLFACDPGDPAEEMPNYLTLLRSYGFEPLEGKILADPLAAGTYYEYPSWVIPEMSSTDITMDLVGLGSDYLIMPETRAFAEPEEADRNLLVSPVLRSASTAVLNNGETAKSAEEGYPLALQARRVTSEGYISRAFIIGCSYVMTDKSLYSPTDSQRFTIQVMDFLLQTDGSGLNITPKDAVRPGLRSAGVDMGSVILIALPLSVLAAALLVLGPRRNA